MLFIIFNVLLLFPDLFTTKCVDGS